MEITEQSLTETVITLKKLGLSDKMIIDNLELKETNLQAEIDCRLNDINILRDYKEKFINEAYKLDLPRMRCGTDTRKVTNSL